MKTEEEIEVVRRYVAGLGVTARRRSLPHLNQQLGGALLSGVSSILAASSDSEVAACLEAGAASLGAQRGEVA